MVCWTSSRRETNISTNRATGPPAATSSSACSAFSRAADAVSFHANRPVAANQTWTRHIEDIVSMAEMGSHSSQARKGTNVTTASIQHAQRKRLECLNRNWSNQTVSVRPASYVLIPPSALHECQDTNAQDLQPPCSSQHVPWALSDVAATNLLKKTSIARKTPLPIHKAPVAVGCCRDITVVHLIPARVTHFQTRR